MEENSLKSVMKLLTNILNIDPELNDEAYLKQFIKNIAQNLEIKYAFLGHPVSESLLQIQTDVVWAGNDFIDNFVYELKDTPCELVLNKFDVCLYDSKVCEHFPKDLLLQEMGIESYVGAQVISKDKNKLSSILFLMDDKPIENRELFSSIIEFLATKASIELEKLQIKENLKNKIEKSNLALEEAGKEIFSLNQNLELERSEKKFKMLFELSPIGMAMVDMKTGNFLEVNQSLIDFTGYEKEELLELSFWDITPSYYQNQEEKQLSELVKKGKFGPNEKEYIKKDGTKVPIKISGFSLTNPDGKEVVWGLIEDITKSKQYEIIYQDNKELLEYITIENDLQKILDKIVYLAEKRNEHSKCSILLLDETKTKLLTGSAPSLPDFYNQAINGMKIGEKVGSCGSAAYKKQRVIIENIATHENWQRAVDLAKKANLYACWSEPIISSENEVLGTFAIYSNQPKTPNEFELKLIETYANIASKAIEKHNHTKYIKDNNFKLEQLFNNSYSGLLFIDKDRKIVKANQRFADIMDYKSPDDLLGLSMESFHLNNERFLEFGEKYFPIISQKGEALNIEFKMAKKDGTPIWCKMSGKALDRNLPADLSKGVLWTVNDISLRILYEQELKNKQFLLKNILATIPDLLWVKDQDGVYLACNPEFEAFFGASEEEIVGKTDYDFVNKELADFFRMHDKNAMNATHTLINEEWVTYATTGKDVLLDTSKKAMRDDNGVVLGVLGIGHDVTERKQREDELKKLNSFTKSLIDDQQVLLSLFDKGESALFKWRNDEVWSVEYVSKSIDQLLDYSVEDFTSKKIAYIDCVHKADLPRAQSDVAKAIENNVDYFKHEPYRIVTKNKTTKWILDHAVTQKNTKGEITHFIGYITDITEQIQNQEMLFNQSKIASLGEMLENISHQWRQPLSIISTLATGLKLKKEFGILEDNELITNLDGINNNTQYLSNTIDDFRNFFLSDKTIKVELKLKDSLEKVISLIKDSYKSSNIQIIKDIDYDVTRVYNESLLIQALINIFNNAKDALNAVKDKDFEKLVFIDLIKDKDDYVIKITDNAGGIPEKVIDKVFEPYFTTKHKSQGTGIGLYMTNQIITKHLNSEISVKNLGFTYMNKNYTGASFFIKIKAN